MGAIDSWALLILVLFVLVPVGLLMIFVIKAIFGGGSSRREDPDTRAEMDDLRDLADRMERRMENLETILTDRPYAGRETQSPSAADRSDVL